VMQFTGLHFSLQRQHPRHQPLLPAAELTAARS
jgi:hypothetical protein